MGQCYGKTIPSSDYADGDQAPQSPLPASAVNNNTPARSSGNFWPSPYPQSATGGVSPLPVGVSPSSTRSTPRRFFKRPFPPPSPAKHIKASLAKRFGQSKPREGPIPEDGTAEPDGLLDKNFGYNKNFGAKYELGKEIGRGHFGHTCHAKGRKGELKDQPLAVKIISKSKVFSFLILIKSQNYLIIVLYIDHFYVCRVL